MNFIWSGKTHGIPFSKCYGQPVNDMYTIKLIFNVTIFACFYFSGSKNIAVGVTKTVTIAVDIRNARENAFINHLELVYPPVVSPNKVTIENVRILLIIYFNRWNIREFEPFFAKVYPAKNLKSLHLRKFILRNFALTFNCTFCQFSTQNIS